MISNKYNNFIRLGDFIFKISYIVRGMECLKYWIFLTMPRKLLIEGISPGKKQLKVVPKFVFMYLFIDLLSG